MKMTDEQKTEIEQTFGKAITSNYIKFLQMHEVPHSHILMLAFGHGAMSEKYEICLNLKKDMENGKSK